MKEEGEEEERLEATMMCPLKNACSASAEKTNGQNIIKEVQLNKKKGNK